MQNSIELIDANLYLKDGSRKFVSILGNMNSADLQEEKIEYITNSNIEEYLKTGFSQYIERIELKLVDAIDVTLK